MIDVSDIVELSDKELMDLISDYEPDYSPMLRAIGTVISNRTASRKLRVIHKNNRIVTW